MLDVVRQHDDTRLTRMCAKLWDVHLRDGEMHISRGCDVEAPEAQHRHRPDAATVARTAANCKRAKVGKLGRAPRRCLERVQYRHILQPRRDHLHVEALEQIVEFAVVHDELVERARDEPRLQSEDGG